MWSRDRPHDVRTALFGGQRAVRVWSLPNAELAAPFAAVLACELEPGGSVGPHVQAQFAEVVIGVSGHGTADVDGVASPLEAGSVVDLALGRALAIRNGSETNALRYLIVKAAVG